MDRAVFLEMCKKVAMLHNGVAGVKKPPIELQLKHKGMTFYPIGYKLTFDKDGKPMHIAILHDLKVNSIIECDLLKIRE